MWKAFSKVRHYCRAIETWPPKWDLQNKLCCVLFLSTVFINVLSDFSLLPQSVYYTRESRISPASQAVVNTLRQKHNKQLLPVPRHVLTRSARSTAVVATLSGRGLFGTIFGIFKATSIISPFKTPSLAPFLPKECGQHRLCRQLKKLFVMLCLIQNIVKSERVGSHFQPLTGWTCDWELTLLAFLLW